MPRLSEAKAILIIRLDELGDVILTSPLLREVRKNAPHAYITLVVNKSNYDLVKTCPYVNKVLACNWKAVHYELLGKWGVRCKALAFRLKYVWSHFQDVIVIPRRGPDFYGAEFLGRLWTRHGLIVACRDSISHRNGEQRRPRRLYFVNHAVEHEVAHNLRLIEFLGGCVRSESLEVWPTRADNEFAEKFLRDNFTEERVLVVLHPSGGRSELKQWPIERFVELADNMVEKCGANILVIGGAEEEWMNLRFRESASVKRAVGLFTLNQLAAIFSQTRVFVGGDSGIMHLAAAAGAPVVGIFGPTSEIRFRPLGGTSQVVTLRYACSPDAVGSFIDRCSCCHFDQPRCLTELPMSAVLSVVAKALVEVRKPPPTIEILDRS